MEISQDNLERARTLFLAALAQREAGDLGAAEQGLCEALQLSPGRESILVNLAEVRIAGQRWAEALPLCEQACLANPASAPGWLNVGLCLHGLGRADEALLAFERNLALEPANPVALLRQARIHNAAGRHVDALATAELLTHVVPTSAEAWCAQGLALGGLGRFLESLEAYRQALALAPEWLEACMEAGNAATDAGRIEEAVSFYERALALDSANHEVCHNLGNAHAVCGRFEIALSFYARALELRPGAPLSVCNRALAHLALGDYARGFADFEARWQTGLQPPHGQLAPLWQGETLAGKRVLVHTEQGFGDVVMFARFVIELAQRGARVQLAVPAPLQALLAGLAGVESVISRRELQLPCDYQCPIMSLPFGLGITLESLPARIPYLEVSPAYREKWRTQGRLGAFPRIGLVWACSENGPYAVRSMPLEVLQPLAGVKAQFVALQKNAPAEDCHSWQSMPWLEDMSTELEDFADTAALIEQLDLVISVDTAVAHIAGALGKPAWVLLPHVADWRWQAGGGESVWYPGVRLLRQPAQRDWAGLVHQQLLPALADYLSTRLSR